MLVIENRRTGSLIVSSDHRKRAGHWLTSALPIRCESSLVFFGISWGQPDQRQSDECRGTLGTQRCGYGSPNGWTWSAPASLLLLFCRLDTAVGHGRTCLRALIGRKHNTLSHRIDAVTGR